MLCLAFTLFIFLTELIYPPWSHAGQIGESISDETLIHITATITKIEHKDFSVSLYLKDISIISEQKQIPENEHNGTAPGPEGLIAYLGDNSEKEGLHIGSRVYLSGEFSSFDRAENEGNFDAFKYYSVRHIDGRLKKAKIISVSDSYCLIADFLYRIKERTIKVYTDHLDEEKAGTLTALILGDKTGLDREIKESYQNAGIAHILSLSGLHIAAIGMLLVTLIKKTGAGIRLSSVISGVIMLLYSIMTGLSTSTVRALIMFIMGVTALSLKRTYDLLSAAAFSAALQLVWNPFYLYDSGFLLSFSAVMGIGILHPVFRECMGVILKRPFLHGLHNSKSLLVKPLKALGSSVLFSLSIQFATLPVTQYSFYQIPVFGILLNLVVIPLMSGLLGAGMLLSLIGNIELSLADKGILHGLFKIAATAAAKIADVILNIYDILTDNSNKISGNLWICGKPSRIQIAIYYFLIAGAVLGSAILSGRKKAARIRENSAYKNRSERSFERFNLILPLILAAAVCILSLRFRAPLELHAISVGQGDCMLIFGKDTPVILIDGGASDVKNTGKYRMLPCIKAYGLDRIDYIFISHFDADHVNGIIELLKDVDNGIDIGRVVISDVVPLMEENPNFSALKEAACKNMRIRKEGVPVMLMNAGDIIKEGEIILSCLGPDVKGSESWREGDINDNSMILHLYYKRSGFSAIFTGDISEKTEKGLIRDHLEGKEYLKPLDRPVTLLKAAHHGSNTAGSEEFLSVVSPRITTISCGIDNSYGHPHKEALDRLKRVAGNRIYQTNTDGEISVIVKEGLVRIKTYKKQEDMLR